MTRSVRIIARLDVKSENLVKGVHLEGLRKLGNPHQFARSYYEQGIDELIYIDIVASLYQRNNLLNIVSETAKEVFVPITVGGGIRSINDAKAALRAGADKLAINTAAVNNPNLIRQIADQFGSQCMVLSVEAMRQPGGGWKAFIDNGREHTGKDVLEWVQEAEFLGAGEILLTSIDQEGTGKGFDIDLLQSISNSVGVPVIASGGMGNLNHYEMAIKNGGVDAVAVANVLHYNKLTVHDIRQYSHTCDIPVRTFNT